MPDAISASSRANSSAARTEWESSTMSSRAAKQSAASGAAPSCRGFILDPVRLMRHHAGLEEPPHHLQKTKAHEIGSERNAEIDDPAWPLELLRDLVGIKLVDVDG